MKLKFKTKTKSKAKTAKQKQIDKEKKDTKNRINENYQDNSDFNLSNVSLELNKLTFGIIRCCDVQSITIEEDSIQLNSSWVELLLIMIDDLVSNYDDWRQRLINNEVQSQTFQITDVYGKVDLENNYEVYKIYDKNLYLEAVFSESNIFRALIGLTKALEMKPSQISVFLKNKNFVETELNYSSLKSNEVVYNLSDYEKILETLNNKGHIISAKIDKEYARVHSIIQLFGAFMTSLSKRESELINFKDKEKLINSVNNTGFVFEKAKNCMSVPESNIIVATDGNEKDILLFMLNICNKLNIDIKVKLRQFVLEKKEWEVD